MQIAGDNLKRRASLTGQQQRAVVFGGRFNTAVHFLNDGTVAQFVQSHAGGRLNFAMFQGAFYCGQEFLQGNRFFQKIERADFSGFNRSVNAGMAAHHNHRHIELAVFRPLFQQSDAVAIGHPNVQQYHGRTRLITQLARFFGIFGQSNGIAFILKDFGEQVADAYFIIYNQNITASHKFLPFPVKLF